MAPDTALRGLTLIQYSSYVSFVFIIKNNAE